MRLRGPAPSLTTNERRWYAQVMRFALFVLTVALLASAPALAQTITGPARVIDGDTLDIDGQRIRPHGIDAPEKTQTCRIEGTPWACGIAAWGELVQLVAGKDVSCEMRDIDRYSRVVAVCSADGENINAAMVAQGWALAYLQFSDDYVPQEGKAREAHLGMWRGEFVPPWDWLRGDRLVAAPTTHNSLTGRARPVPVAHRAPRQREPLSRMLFAGEAVGIKVGSGLHVLGHDPLHVRDPRLPPAEQPAQ